MPARRLVRFTFRRRLTTVFSAILLTLFFTGSLSSQTAQPQPSPAPQQSNNSGAAQVPGAGVAVQNQQPGTGTNQAAEPPEPETHVTKSQAKELFRSVDEILDFVSQDTGLPIEHKVKRNLITRRKSRSMSTSA